MGEGWTKARTDRLAELVAGGYSAAAIGADLGVTRNMVIGKAARSGMQWPPRVSPVPRPPAAQVAWARDLPRFLELVGDGASPAAIAVELGRSVEQVRDKAQRLGVKFGHHGRGGGGLGMVPKPDRPRALPTTPPAPLPAIDGRPVHFLARRPGQCVWPLWSGRDRIGLCCGAAAAVGEPYCAEHRAAAWAGLGRRYAKVKESVG
jgi:GcrA cell cycle regulator